MNKIKIASDAHKRREQFLEIHGVSRLMEIKLLHAMWKNEDYKSLGFESFKDFMEAPTPSGGLDVSRSWAVELILTYQRYVVELGIEEKVLIEISPRKLYFLKNQVNEDNCDEILAQAQTMTLTQLQLESKNIDTVNCKHEDIETLKHCRTCSAWIKE